MFSMQEESHSIAVWIGFIYMLISRGGDLDRPVDITWRNTVLPLLGALAIWLYVCETKELVSLYRHELSKVLLCKVCPGHK